MCGAGYKIRRILDLKTFGTEVDLLSGVFCIAYGHCTVVRGFLSSVFCVRRSYRPLFNFICPMLTSTSIYLISNDIQ